MKIFSFCIYGDNMKYYLGLRENIRLIQSFFPDFHIFIYCGLNRRDDFLNTISRSEKIHLIDTNKEGTINMVYRYMPFLLADAEIVFSRDADSEINARDRWAIRDFLQDTYQKTPVQTIRDHYYHKSRLSGGLTGFHLQRLQINNHEMLDNLKTVFSQIIQNISSIENIHYGDDEKILNERIWPLLKDQVIVYSNINVFEGENYKTIDFENDGDNFCGNVILYEKVDEKLMKLEVWKLKVDQVIKQANALTKITVEGEE
jgi:hypothetical protein